jgi:hypothetical protein
VSDRNELYVVAPTIHYYVYEDGSLLIVDYIKTLDGHFEPGVVGLKSFTPKQSAAVIADARSNAKPGRLEDYYPTKASR